MTDDAKDLEAGLRGASDGLLIAIEQLTERERFKRAVHPSDARFVLLARDVRMAAEDVLRLAAEEERFAGQANELSHVQDVSLETIEATKPPRDLAAILAEWRAVERELQASPADSAAAIELMTRFDMLRDRYAEALSRIRHRGSDDGPGTGA